MKDRQILNSIELKCSLPSEKWERRGVVTSGLARAVFAENIDNLEI